MPFYNLEKDNTFAKEDDLKKQKKRDFSRIKFTTIFN